MWASTYLDVVIVTVGAHRPVHQVQIQIFQAELLQRLAQALFDRLRIAVVVVPQLACDPDVLPRQAHLLQPLGDTLPNSNLVSICSSGVDVAVAGLNSDGHGFGGILRRDFKVPGAEAQERGCCGGVWLDGRLHLVGSGECRDGDDGGAHCVE